MTAITVERETNNYWNLIKDAGSEVKLALITLFSASMSKDSDVQVKTRKLKAHRLNSIADNEMEQLMQGEPTPITDVAETNLADIVSANSGRIINGMEKWL